MVYYALRCETCQETFKPLLATEPGELLCPIYDDTCPCCGGTRHKESMNMGQLEDFHHKHAGHNLVEVQEEH